MDGEKVFSVFPEKVEKWREEKVPSIHLKAKENCVLPLIISFLSVFVFLQLYHLIFYQFVLPKFYHLFLYIYIHAIIFRIYYC